MRKKAILITGASGEIGQALIASLAESSPLPILTLDLHAIPPELSNLCIHMAGDILLAFLENEGDQVGVG